LRKKASPLLSLPWWVLSTALPLPRAPHSLKVGAKVSNDSVVCIIEAMKVMNEIQAEMSGTITELLVENGEAVEYGQPLFKIKTA
jgi:acetyl-CoA carboxylase biotin carboxyl carrier protein